MRWAAEVVERNPQHRFESRPLVAELRRRREMAVALESYLMANRGTGSSEEFISAADQLATGTLAYSLATDQVKPG